MLFLLLFLFLFCFLEVKVLRVLFETFLFIVASLLNQFLKRWNHTVGIEGPIVQLAGSQWTTLPVGHALTLANLFTDQLLAHSTQPYRFWAVRISLVHGLVVGLQVGQTSDLLIETELGHILVKHVQIARKSKPNNACARIHKNTFEYGIELDAVSQRDQVNEAGICLAS